MRVWSFAAREARKGKWEQFVRDRDRFSNRIKFLAQYLNPILSQTHRDKIYKERFQAEDEKQCDKQTKQNEEL